MSGAGKPAAMRLRGCDGFTLIEVLVVLTILSLLAGIVFPAVDKAMRRQAFIETASRFEAALHGARARAIRAGGKVRFALSGDRRNFGYRGSVERLPEGVRASLPDDAVDFFADGSSTGGQAAVAEGRWELRWYIRPSTGAIERAR